MTTIPKINSSTTVYQRYGKVKEFVLELGPMRRV